VETEGMKKKCRSVGKKKVQSKGNKSSKLQTKSKQSDSIYKKHHAKDCPS